jgi:histidine phosphotransferase ChpT
MTDAPAAQPDALPASGAELAAYVAAKLCHDFVSPAGAVMSGLDLLSDPSAADMRDDAIALITDSAAKLLALIHYCRVAFGAATTSERFNASDLKGLVEGVSKGGRAALDWRIEETDLAKPASRALVNLAYLTLGALPTGGTATLTSRRDGDRLILTGSAEGARARLKAEAAVGLSGERLTDGLVGQWTQPYWLWLTVREAGGVLTHAAEDGRVLIEASLPL